MKNTVHTTNTTVRDLANWRNRGTRDLCCRFAWKGPITVQFRVFSVLRPTCSNIATKVLSRKTKALQMPLKSAPPPERMRRMSGLPRPVIVDAKMVAHANKRIVLAIK
jgi:hypothetical protein